MVKHFKTKKEPVPSLLDVSSDGHYSLEVSKDMPTTVLMRSLKTNSISAKFEGHSQSIGDLKFAQND